MAFTTEQQNALDAIQAAFDELKAYDLDAIMREITEEQGEIPEVHMLREANHFALECKDKGLV